MSNSGVDTPERPARAAPEVEISAMIQLSRALRMHIPVPEFTRDRFFRRPNLLEADRARLYYWNMCCIALTALPVWFMMTVNYRFCEESVMLSESMKGAKQRPVDLRLYYPEKKRSSSS
ncbi:hypothetical protein Efla_007234 [Eimeria flavescens]